jgi:dolichol-phosphate mannosyltransferase
MDEVGIAPLAGTGQMLKGERSRVVVILPVLNEEKRIRSLVSRIFKYARGFVDKVLVVVDEGTVDGSREEAMAAGAIVLDNGFIRGVGAAIRRGIEYAFDKRFDVCVIMGGDSQDDPMDIPHVLEPILTGKWDFVQGSRYLNGQRTAGMPLSRAILTRLYTLGFRLVTGFPATDASNGFRAFRLDIVKDINLWQECLEKYALENYLYAQVIKRGYRVKEVPVAKIFDRQLGFSHMRTLLLLIPPVDNSFWAVIRGTIEW